MLIMATMIGISATATSTVGAEVSAERPHLQPLPAEPFDTARMLTARVDHKARICVRQCHYSVPARLAGWTVNVRLGATLSRSALAGESSPATNRAVVPGAQIAGG